METAIYLIVESLPAPVRAALATLGYHRPDIRVSTTERSSMRVAGGAGRRGFAALVMADGRTEVQRGSWGGSNMFNPRNAVDMSDQVVTLPVGAYLITGSEGGDRPVYATIDVAPGTLPAELTAGRPDTTEDEQIVLYAYGGLKSGEYRQRTLAQVDPSVIEGLISRGMLKRARNGATQITTAGRNARDGKTRWPK